MYQPNNLITITRKTKARSIIFMIFLLFCGFISAQTRYVDPTGVDAGDCSDPLNPCQTIQYAVDQTLAGDIVLIADGTYNENVTIDDAINQDGISLLSQNGSGVTTIQGANVGTALATVYINGVSNVSIGGPAQGFEIIGYDSPLPGIEEAAIYMRGVCTNTSIIDNIVVAVGEAGLLTETGSTSNLIVDGNIFTGQTFVGEPAGCGFGQQFTLHNVPRQLVTINPGAIAGIQFTNNVVNGITGGTNTTDGCEQGNTLVTIDADNPVIEYNTFAGTTTRFATSLRVRGDAATIRCNTFDNSGLSDATSHIFIDDSQGFPLTGGNPNTIAGIAQINEFIDDGGYIDPPGNPTANAYPYYIYKNMADATFVAGILGRTAIQASLVNNCCNLSLDWARNELNLCSGDTLDFWITNDGIQAWTFDLTFIDSMDATVFPKDLDPENAFPFDYNGITVNPGDTVFTKDLMPPPVVMNMMATFDRGRVLMGITNIERVGDPACTLPDIGPAPRLGVGTRIYPAPKLASVNPDTVCNGDEAEFDIDLSNLPSLRPDIAGFPVVINWTVTPGPGITGAMAGSIEIYDNAGNESQVLDIVQTLNNTGTGLDSVVYCIVATSAGDDGQLGTDDDCLSDTLKAVAYVTPPMSVFCPVDVNFDTLCGMAMADMLPTGTNRDTAGANPLWPTVLNGCGTVMTDYTDDTTTIGCTMLITRKVVATDENGQMDSCEQHFVIQFDTVAPNLIGVPANDTVQCAGDAPAPAVVTAMDTCDASTNVWINEVHYRDQGADEMEFVEIAGKAGIDLSRYSLSFINGWTGGEYHNFTFSGTMAEEDNCIGTAVHFLADANETLMQGAGNNTVDGVALILDGTIVIDFVSWGSGDIKTIKPDQGPAIGHTPRYINAQEPGNGPATQSIFKTGVGVLNEDFTWSYTTSSTPGALNAGQTISAGLVCPDLEVNLAIDTLNEVCAHRFDIRRIWSAEDCCGNVAMDTQIVVVNDTTRPALICVDTVRLYLDEMGEAMFDTTDLFTSVIDNCSDVTLTLSRGNMFDCGDIGNHPVILTATDSCGNANMCTVIVTVADTMAPNLVCPNDFYIHLDEGECERIVWFVDPYATDNCEEVLETGMLQSTFNSNNQFAGNMFDLENISGSPITIMSFDGNINAVAGNPCSFEVFYRQGTYVGFENSPVGWTSMGTANSVTAGINQPTPVPIGGLTIPAGETYAIYFVLTSYPAPGSLRYTNGNNTYNNGDLELRAGVGKGNPNFNGGTFNSRTWNGNIHYAKSVGGPVIVEQIDNTGFTNGDFFPIGQTCLEYRATDFVGNTSTCEVCINVSEYPQPIYSLTCNDHIQISLDETCMLTVTADMILEGGPYRCYDAYTIRVLDNNGNEVDLDNDPTNGVQLSGAHVGNCYKVEVIDPDYGNKCWGELCIEDKLSPTVICQDDTVSCDANTDPLCLGGSVPCPIAMDACDPFVSSKYVDWETDGSCQSGFEKIINRRWTFIDESGNSTICDQRILVELGTLLDVVVPGHYDDHTNPALLCDEKIDHKDVSSHIINFPYCVDGYLLDSAHWFATGGNPAIADQTARDLSGDRLPRTLGWNCIDQGPYAGHPSPYAIYYEEHPQWQFFGACWGPDQMVKWLGTGTPSGNNCSNIEYTFQDTEFDLSDPDCEAGSVGCYKVLRHWTVVDWCSGEYGGYDQVIKILDKEAPEIVMPDEIEVGTDAWKCEGILAVPAPWIIDNCAEEVHYNVVVKNGQVLGNEQTGYTVVGLELGEHTMYIEAFDCCGNRAVDSITLNVVDNTPPICISEDRVQLSLAGSQSPGTNFSSVCAVDLDQASYDNCAHQLYFKTIRMDELLGTVNGSFLDNVDACGGINGDDDVLIDGNQVYFDDCAKFCCEDADQIIMVVLRVFDVSPGPGPVHPLRMTPPGGDLVGHFTDCWVEVDVRDKAQPIIVAPPDIVISCMFWFDDSEDALSDVTNPTFGRVVTDLNDRQKVETRDFVCEEWCEDHPHYGYEPIRRNSPLVAADACDFYNQLYDPGAS